MNNCKHLTIRSKNYEKYFYCRLDKKVVNYTNECKKCLKIEPRKNKGINKRTSKQNKLEKDRDKSLIKKGYCEYCGRYSDGLDPHEVYGGSNRKRSILNGFVKLLCRECHQNEDVLQELKVKTQEEFEQEKSREEFIKIIGKSYIKSIDKE